MGSSLRSGNENDPRVLGETKAGEFWANRSEFVSIGAQKVLLDSTIESFLLKCLIVLFILGKENLKRTGLISNAVHTVNFDVHSPVKSSASNNILQL
jgi:hypothetical protein